MNFGQLFTSFEGRISRKEWWIGFILLYVIQFVVYFAAVAIGIIPADAGTAGPAGPAGPAGMAPGPMWPCLSSFSSFCGQLSQFM